MSDEKARLANLKTLGQVAGQQSAQPSATAQTATDDPRLANLKKIGEAVLAEKKNVGSELPAQSPGSELPASAGTPSSGGAEPEPLYTPKIGLGITQPAVQKPVGVGRIIEPRYNFGGSYANRWLDTQPATPTQEQPTQEPPKSYWEGLGAEFWQAIWKIGMETEEVAAGPIRDYIRSKIAKDVPDPQKQDEIMREMNRQFNAVGLPVMSGLFGMTKEVVLPTGTTPTTPDTWQGDALKMAAHILPDIGITMAMPEVKAASWLSKFGVKNYSKFGIYLGGRGMVQSNHAGGDALDMLQAGAEGFGMGVMYDGFGAISGKIGEGIANKVVGKLPDRIINEPLKGVSLGGPQTQAEVSKALTHNVVKGASSVTANALIFGGYSGLDEVTRAMIEGGTDNVQELIESGRLGRTILANTVLGFGLGVKDVGRAAYAKGMNSFIAADKEMISRAVSDKRTAEEYNSQRDEKLRQIDEKIYEINNTPKTETNLSEFGRLADMVLSMPEEVGPKLSNESFTTIDAIRRGETPPAENVRTLLTELQAGKDAMANTPAPAIDAMIKSVTDIYNSSAPREALLGQLEGLKVEAATADNLANLKAMGEQAVTNPTELKQSVEESALPEQAKQELTQKIDEVAFENDPRKKATDPIVSEIEKLQTEIDQIDRSADSPVRKDARKKPIQARMNELKKQVEEAYAEPDAAKQPDPAPSEPPLAAPDPAKEMKVAELTEPPRKGTEQTEPAQTAPERVKDDAAQQSSQPKPDQGATDGKMNDSWYAEFERAKSENDIPALDILYNKVKVALNGVAQSKGPETVKQFEQLKADMESYAEKLKSEKQQTEQPTEPPRTDGKEKEQGLQEVAAEKTGQPTETVPPAPAKGWADQAIDFLDGLKIDTQNKAFDATLGLPVAIWNGSIEVIKAGIKAGKAVNDAIRDGLEWAKSQGHKVDDKEYFAKFGGVPQQTMDGVKERKFFSTIQNADNISKDTKDKLSEDPNNRFYVVKSNAISKQQASDYIEQFGLDQTVNDLLTMGNEMNPDSRTFLSQEAMRRLDAMGSESKKSGDNESSERYFEQATKVAENLIANSTLLGRAVQSFRTLGSAERVVYNARKAVKKKRDALKEKNKEGIEKKKSKAKEAVEGAVDQALQENDVKEKISKSKRKPTDPAESLAKRIISRLNGPKDRFDPVREMVNVLFGKVDETMPPKDQKKEPVMDKLIRVISNKEQYAETWQKAKSEVLRLMEEKGYPQEIIDEYRSQLDAFYNEVIGKPYSESMVDRAIRERGERYISFIVNFIEKGGYDAREFRDEIAERIVFETGAKQDQADLLAESIVKNINEKISAIKERNEAKAQEAIDRIERIKEDAERLRNEQKSKGGNVPVWGNRKKQAAEILIRKLTKNKETQPTLVQEFAQRLNAELGKRIKELGFSDSESKKPNSIDVLIEVLKNADKYEDVISLARDQVKERYKSDPKTLELLDNYLGQISKKSFSESMVDAATGEAIAASDIDLNKLIREHYTVYDATKRTLIDKLIKDAGLSPEDAAMLSESVSKAFDRAARRRIDGVKDRLLSRGTKKPGKRKTDTEELIDMLNMGMFSDAEFVEWYAKTHNWPSIKSEDIQQLRDLVDKVHGAKDGFQKYRATEDLMKFQQKMNGITWGEIGQSFWYVNMLSGLPTHVVNFLANTYNTAQLLGVAATRNPKQVPAMILGMVNGFNRGLYEAVDAWKTGYAPVKFGKLEMPNILEVVSFKGGKWNPANYAKFVRRAMVASDMLHYSINNEMRSYQWARNQAKSDGIKSPSIADIQNRLFNTPQRIAEAKQQAESEGLTGVDFKRRVFELVEQSRPVEMVEDASNFASRATFNYEPEGSLGLLTDGINKITDGLNINGVRPLKFIVPFTNIISNVANNAIDYTPYGFVRAAKGGIGFKGYPKSKYREYTREERIDEVVKASIGIASMVAMYALTEPDENGNALIEITASGTGDPRKNYELRETGWRPYSIKVGDKYISYQYSPLSLALAPIGFLRDREKYRKETLNDDGVMAIFSATSYGTFRFMMDMTFLGTMNDFITAISSDNPSTGIKMLESSAGKVIKTMAVPNFYTHAQKFYNEKFDIPAKEASGVWQQLYKDVPIARNGLYDKINSLGDPVVLKTDRIWSDAEYEPVYQFIIDNNAFIGTPRRESVIIEYPEQRLLTDEEYYNFLKIRGKKIKDGIIRLMEMEKASGQKIPKAMVQKQIDDIKQKATREAKASQLSIPPPNN